MRTDEPRGCLQSRWGGSSPQPCHVGCEPRTGSWSTRLLRLCCPDPFYGWGTWFPRCRAGAEARAGLSPLLRLRLLGAGVTSQSTCAPRPHCPLLLLSQGRARSLQVLRVKSQAPEGPWPGGRHQSPHGPPAPSLWLSHGEPVSSESLALPQACGWVLGLLCVSLVMRVESTEPGAHVPQVGLPPAHWRVHVITVGSGAARGLCTGLGLPRASSCPRGGDRARPPLQALGT